MIISGAIKANNFIGGTINTNTGITGEIGRTGDKTYVYTQMSASTTWVINHNLNKYPTVAIVNSAGDEILGGNLHYDNKNTITITFDNAFAGKAYCN